MLGSYCRGVLSDIEMHFVAATHPGTMQCNLRLAMPTLKHILLSARST